MDERRTPIFRLLSEIKEALNELARAVTKGNKTAERPDKPKNHTELHAEVGLPIEICTYYKAEEAERPKTNKRENIRVGLEIAGVSAAALVAFLTFGTLLAINGQLKEMRRQTRQSLESFKIEERAWIEIKPIIPQPIHNSTAVYQYDIYPRNVGKTAARNVVTHADNFGETIAPIENTRHPEWIHNWQDNYLFGKFKNGGPLDAGTPVPSVIGPNTESPIPITFRTQAPTFSPDGKSELVGEIMGRIDYDDEFRVHHWIRFCYYPANSKGELASCKAGNEEDDNPELPPPNENATFFW